MTKYLSQEFLSQFRGVHPKNAGPLFEVTYLGKYSRWLPELKRRETWDEVCERTVEYSLSLYQGPATHEDLVKEAELMYSYMFNLLSLPSGRSMRIGGTESVKAHPESAFNCTGTVISELEDFCDVFHLTMCSCGVGFRNLKSDVDKLPLLSTDFTISHDKYFTVYPYIKVEDTTVEYQGYVGPKRIYRITVGDSKLGWVDSLRQYLKIISTDFSNLEIQFNYDYVRPEKSRLNTWGGHAAGPEGLMKMFDNLTRIVKVSNGKLRPIDVLDICTYIAKNVVVGGTRRAALIALFSPDDYECRSAKRILGYFGHAETKEPVVYDDYNDIKLAVEYTGKIKWFSNKEYEHRTMSNNSIVFDYKPSYGELKEIFKSIRHNGEPGFFNKAAANRRRPNAEVLNPCAEIIMDNKGVCNLSTVVLPSHIVDGPVPSVNYETLEQAVRLAARVGLRQTNVTLSLPKWDFVQKRDRLIGPSKTGEMDFLDKLGIKTNSFEHTRILETMNFWANDEADRYAFEMRVPRPLLVTSIKPEGSLSLLATVSCGVHRSYAPFYIRRFKFADFDPMCKALMSMGVPYEKDCTKSDSNRYVFEFPIKSAAQTKAVEEPFRDQFNRYLVEQKYYTDHNTSCTLYVGKDEWEEALQMTYDNWDDVIAVSFLPKDEGIYPQAPFQAISKEEYEARAAKMPELSNLAEVVSKYELEESDSSMDDQEICSTGACPTV